MRGRDGDRRAAPARGDYWADQRDRDRPRGPPSKIGRRSRSRSPIKSKLMALAMSTGGREANRSRREDSRDRDRTQKGRLRMDELDGKRLNIKARTPEHRRSDTGGLGQKNKLDKVVKKAREERTNYWDKKILEAEEKDPDRWGHSGYKELYHKKDSKKVAKSFPKKRPRSRSGTPKRGMRSLSGSASPKFRGRRQSRSRSISPSFSRSRSPIKRIAKSRKDLRSFSRSVSPVTSTKPKIGLNDARVLPKTPTAGSSGSKANGQQALRKPAARAHQSKSGPPVGDVNFAGSGRPLAKIKTSAFPKKRQARRSSSFSSSGSSISRSPEPKSGFQTSAKKRNIGGKPYSAKHSKGGKPTVASDSYSSSTSSSDEDVLQLHAKQRARSSSFSDSRSSSSSRERDRISDIVRRASSSSSESQTSTESDSDISIRAKPLQKKTVTNKDKVAIAPKKPGAVVKLNPTPIPPTATVAVGNTDGSAILAKSAPNKKSTDAVAVRSIKLKSGTLNTTKPTVISKSKSIEKEKIVTKKGSESGETESESESDSDSEPRMTLSERFAKLSQMSTDKREMAKPVLSVNEIDTKMRVVKDFRNPEVPKVFPAGDVLSTSANRAKPSSRNPPAFPPDSRRDTDMPPDDRHQHFERMYRDVPAEQPLDWSDPRVRFNYYKNRGCFDERPITFDEYIKWEDWYHKYREWLEQEAYYSQQQQSGRAAPSPGNRMQMKGVGGFPLGRRMDQTPMANGPLLSSRAHFGRPEDSAYLQAHSRIGRRIDRTVGGSLVVNIRPYNNNGERGFQTRRHMGRPQ